MDNQKIEIWIEILKDNNLLHSKQIKILQNEIRELKEMYYPENQVEHKEVMSKYIDQNYKLIDSLHNQGDRYLIKWKDGSESYYNCEVATFSDNEVEESNLGGGAIEKL